MQIRKSIWFLLWLTIGLQGTFCRSLNDNDDIDIILPDGHHDDNSTQHKCVTPPARLSGEKKCRFVQENCSGEEDSPGFVNYLEFYYCTMSGKEPWAVIILGMHLAFLFIFLGTAASDYFCPNLTTLSNVLQLPPDIAGVTLLATGNCIADLASNLVAINNAGSVEMALGELIGSSLFVGGVVMGAVAYYAKFPSDPTTTHVQIKREVFLRDAGFFLISIVVLGLIAIDGMLTWWKGLISLGVYFVYLTIIVVRYVRKRRARTLRCCVTDGHHHHHHSKVRHPSVCEDDFVQTRRASAFSLDFTEDNEPLVKPRSQSRLSTQSNKSLAQKKCDKILADNLKSPIHRTSINNAVIFSDVANKVLVEHEKNVELPYHLNEPIVLSQQKSVARFCPTCSKLPAPDFSQNMFSLRLGITCRHFLPIFWTWNDQSTIGRIVSALNFPAVFILSATVPVVAQTAEDELQNEDVSVDELDSVASSSESYQCVACGCDCSHDDLEVFDEKTPFLNESFTSNQSVVQKRIETELDWHYRWILLGQMFLSPLVVLFSIGYAFENLGGLPGYAVGMVIGALSWLIVFVATHPKVFTKFGGDVENSAFYPFKHPFFCIYGFVIGLFWIYLVANEIVSLLKSLGRILAISEAILGITVFAFGNSVGDFVSNVTMARMGFPTMSISASFAGPLIVILVTLGVSGLMTIGKDPLPIPINQNLLLTYIGLLLMMAANLIAIPMLKYRVGKKYGLFIVGLYTFVIAFTVICATFNLNLTGLLT